MSRFTAKIPENNVVLAWGYDRPMSEYFFQAFKEDVKDDEDDCLFSIASYTTLTPHPRYPDRKMWSNSEIVALMKEYVGEVPELQQAIHYIQADLPF